jgi:outer membrane lipoprotein-sorting protein
MIVYSRRAILSVCLVFLLAPARAAWAVEDPPVQQALDALYKRGQDLKDFAAEVRLTETDALGSDTVRVGRVLYQLKGNGDARIRVAFDRKKLSGQMIKQRIEYLLDDGKLVDQNYDTKLQVTRQVLKPGQRLNPLKLGEGPFPLPIGQEPAEVQKMFEVTTRPPAKDDPAETTHVILKPKAGTRFANKFQSIDVYVDKKTNFPDRIETVDRDGTTVRTTDLSNIQINQGLKDGDFQLPPPGKDWGVRDEELTD